MSRSKPESESQRGWLILVACLAAVLLAAGMRFSFAASPDRAQWPARLGDAPHPRPAVVPHRRRRVRVSLAAREDADLVAPGEGVVHRVGPDEAGSAGKEDRRNLERTPGDKKDASGGYVLNPDDPFLQRLFLPATVRVEARDNDPREGSKWGQSEAFTIRGVLEAEPGGRTGGFSLGPRVLRAARRLTTP